MAGVGAHVTRAQDDLPAEVRAFSICEGGSLYRLARRLGLPPKGFIRFGLVAALITWVPLVVLAAFDHVLLGGATVPFSRSLGTHARLLGAIPLFFVAEYLFDARVAEVIKQRGLLDYGALAADYARAFDMKWIGGRRQPTRPCSARLTFSHLPISRTASGSSAACGSYDCVVANHDDRGSRDVAGGAAGARPMAAR